VFGALSRKASSPTTRGQQNHITLGQARKWVPASPAPSTLGISPHLFPQPLRPRESGPCDPPPPPCLSPHLPHAPLAMRLPGLPEHKLVQSQGLCTCCPSAQSSISSFSSFLRQCYTPGDFKFSIALSKKWDFHGEEYKVCIQNGSPCIFHRTSTDV